MLIIKMTELNFGVVKIKDEDGKLLINEIINL